MFGLILVDTVVSMLAISHLPDCISPLSAALAQDFLPTSEDYQAIRNNLVILVCRILTKYIDSLSIFSKAIPPYYYSNEMGMKSEVIVLDVLTKNEAKHSDMINIIRDTMARIILMRGEC